MNTPRIGDRVRDMCGQSYDVVEVQANGYRFRVQPLTRATIDGKDTLVPLGGPVTVGRSDLVID